MSTPATSAFIQPIDYNWFDEKEGQLCCALQAATQITGLGSTDRKKFDDQVYVYLSIARPSSINSLMQLAFPPELFDVQLYGPPIINLIVQFCVSNNLATDNVFELHAHEPLFIFYRLDGSTTYNYDQGCNLKSFQAWNYYKEGKTIEQIAQLVGECDRDLMQSTLLYVIKKLKPPAVDWSRFDYDAQLDEICRPIQLDNPTKWLAHLPIPNLELTYDNHKKLIVLSTRYQHEGIFVPQAVTI